MKLILVVPVLIISVMNVGCADDRRKYEYIYLDTGQLMYGEWEKVKGTKGSEDNQSIDLTSTTSYSHEINVSFSVGYKEFLEAQIGYTYEKSKEFAVSVTVVANRGETIEFYCRSCHKIVELTQITIENGQVTERTTETILVADEPQSAWTIKDSYNNVIKSTMDDFPIIQSKVTATNKDIPILLDGEKITLNGYILNDYSYLSIKDIARILIPTAMAFDFDYTLKKDAVIITTNKKYVPVDESSEEIIDPLMRVNLKITTFYIDTAEVNKIDKIRLSTFFVNKHAFVKLQDIATLLGFSVEYDADYGIVEINTK